MARRSRQYGQQKGLKKSSGLMPIAGPELFFGLVGAVGTDLKLVRLGIERELAVVGYRVLFIHATDLLSRLSHFPKAKGQTKTSEYDRISSLMDAGNKLRRATGCKDVMAMLSVAEIQRIRRQENERRPVESRPEDPAKTPLHRTAYIIHSLKTPEEIATLRDTYGRAMFVISAYAPRERRAESLAKKLCRSEHGSDASGFRDKAWELVQRDEKEGDSFGQNVRHSFPLGDLFVDTSSREQLDDGIKRFIEVLFSHPFHTPTRDEFAMFHAFSAALRSADLARQVGAVVASPTGEITAIGCNEVPCAGGGLYWPEDSPDKRDFKIGYDSSDRTRRQVVAEIMARLRDGKWLNTDKTRGKSNDGIAKELFDGSESEILAGTQVLSAIEYGRSVHAEMAAITDAARRGISLENTTLYCTTFPCHLCARHIIAAGIKRVVYVEPYPKSLAPELYEDSMVVDSCSQNETRVVFEPFVGIAPGMYWFMFRPTGERKDGEGTAVGWTGQGSQPRLRRFVPSYMLIEEDVLATSLAPCLHAAGIKPK